MITSTSAIPHTWMVISKKYGFLLRAYHYRKFRPYNLGKEVGELDKKSGVRQKPNHATMVMNPMELLFFNETKERGYNQTERKIMTMYTLEVTAITLEQR